MSDNVSKASFGRRLSTAVACFFRALSNPEFAVKAAALLHPAPPQPEAKPQPKPQPVEVKPKPVELPPERVHASGLAVLALLQREGRLVDFLQENVAAFSDAEVGAAARVIHAGCSKVLQQHFTVEPILKESEGATVTIPAGFDAQRIRITGNVAGQPPFRGTLKHHGWTVSSVRLPTTSEAMDPRILVAAEVEL